MSKYVVYSSYLKYMLAVITFGWLMCGTHENIMSLSIEIVLVMWKLFAKVLEIMMSQFISYFFVPKNAPPPPKNT